MNESENRLNYTRAEYEQLLIKIDWLENLLEAFKGIDEENEQLKKAIEDFGNNPAGFDWAVLDKIDELEGENKQLKKREKSCVGIEDENKKLKESIQYIFDEINDEYSDKNIYTCEENLSSVLYLISNIYNVVAQILK